MLLNVLVHKPSGWTGFEWQALGCCVCWNPHTHVMVDAAKQAPISGLCTHVLHNMPVPGTAAAACIEMPQCAKIFAHPGSSSILCSCKVYSRKFTFSSGM